MEWPHPPLGVARRRDPAGGSYRVDALRTSFPLTAEAATREAIFLQTLQNLATSKTTTSSSYAATPRVGGKGSWASRPHCSGGLPRP
jgi:hypothetical protein